MSAIKVLTTRIHEREEAIAAEKGKEKGVLANLGRAVYDSGGGEIPEEAVGAVDGAMDEIRTLEDSRGRLFSDEERRSAIGEERKSLNVELRNINNKEATVFEDLGKAAWELWKSGRHVEGIEEALAEPIKAEGRLHAAEDAVIRNTNTLGTSGSIFSRGRALFLAGRRKTASAALGRLWAKAGRLVMEKVDRDDLENTPAANPAAALAALAERREEIGVQLDSLSQEHRNLDTALEELPGKGSVRKQVQGLERSLNDARTTLEGAFRELGQSWLAAGISESSPEVEKQRKELDDLNSRIALLEGEKRDLEIHRTFRETEERRAKQAATVDNLDAEIKKRQAGLKTAKKTLSAIEKELSSLKETLPPMPEK